MDKGSVTHAIRIRKSVRDLLVELKRSAKSDPRFEVCYLFFILGILISNFCFRF